MSLPVLAFEAMTCALFAACLWHARRRGRFALVEIGTTAVYGFALEWLTLRQLGAYHYGSFAIMIDGAPLAVALGWAVIIYAGMAFSDRVRLPSGVRPLLDALLALNVDVALDAIAIRVGMWSWAGVAPDAQWFGVPWGNFWAWFLVVWAFSVLLRGLRPWRTHPVRRWAYAPLAAVLALLALVVANGQYGHFAEPHRNALATFLVVGGSVTLVWRGRPRPLRRGPPDRLIALVPVAFHAYALAVGFGTGIYATLPLLAGVSLLIAALSLSLHVGAWWLGRVRTGPRMREAAL